MLRSRRHVLKALAAAGAVSACGGPPSARATFDEPYRPIYHFTPERNWINDPNGLVYHEGEYHLFFQYNPKGINWGHLSWGHAVSTDLVNWREIGVAIPERDVMIFSGSAVVDHDNTTGFGSTAAPPLVAIYTGYNPRDHSEAQNISYSLDRGRTWREYKGNPILRRGTRGMFRDPRVFWHDATRRWAMAVVRSDDRVVSIYLSNDLRSWREAGSFGPAGAVGGPWEVPELIEVPVDGGGTRWVLAAGITGDAGPAGGSGVQYFVGDFDGERFEPIGGDAAASARWVDYGADFYAAQTWSNIPATDGRRIWIAWMSNTRYAGETPTHPWRGMLTIPRTLHLSRDGDGYALAQRPVRELETLRRERVEIGLRSATDDRVALTEIAALGEAIELQLTLKPDGKALGGVLLNYGERSEARIGYDGRTQSVFVDRTRCGTFGAAGYRARHDAPSAMRGGQVDLHVLLDRSSVEVFADQGRSVITDLLFPDARLSGISLYGEGGKMYLEHLQAWRLASIRP